ncbi:Uncharacterized protein M6B38_226785 [Iris pallida]|uniref:CCHC-type domain-containing protein n=1 Tax=Iris pallida TaxID=29817 RepID=A0AAX6DUH4_IRIPA|nr:Uncharacterized protein M6B38_226785 [Iris pallida]
MTHSPGEGLGETERSATSGGQAPVTSPADGTSVGALGGTPPATSMTVPGAIAGVLPVVPGATVGAAAGILPPQQGTPPVMMGAIPPLPPLPTDMGQMLAFFHQMLESQRAQHEAQHEAQLRQTEVIRQGMEDAHRLAMAAVERQAPQREVQQQQPKIGDIHAFKKLGPRDFKGTEGIIYADDWLEDTERQMGACRLAADLRVEAVGLQLLDIARTWFRNEPALAGEGHTWAEFRALFREKFFFPTDKIGLVRQFQNLQQGSMTVEEYAAEFGRLGRYAEYMVSDPVIRAERFREGLAWDIKFQIPSFYATYAEVYAEARKVERDLGLKPKRDRDAFSGASSSAGPAKRPQLQHQSFQHHQQQGQARASVQRSQQRPGQDDPPCHFCKKPGHLFEFCRRRLGLCLFCGAAGHQMRECPKNSRAAGAAQRAPVQRAPASVPVVQQRGPLPTQQQQFVQHRQQRGGQGRAFTLAAEEVEPIADVVADFDEGDCSTYYGPDDVVGLDLVPQGVAPPDETIPLV